jgi:hypothetical protein
MVTATSPAAGATAVTLNQAIAITFSQEMSGPSMDGSFIVMGPDGNPVSGAVVSIGGTATFTPSGDLMADTTYQAIVTPGATDASGAPLADQYTWSFTTGAVCETSKPTVAATDPVDVAVVVPVNQRIVAIFSAQMRRKSLSRASFKVTRPDGRTIRGTVSYASGAASFKPASGLSPNTHYIATITTQAADLA